MKNIRTKDLVSNIAGWGLWGAGAGIMLNEALSKHEEAKSSTIFQGLGVVLVGALLREFIRPKKRHYNDFVNTFNKKQSEKVVDKILQTQPDAQVEQIIKEALKNL